MFIKFDLSYWVYLRIWRHNGAKKRDEKEPHLVVRAVLTFFLLKQLTHLSSQRSWHIFSLKEVHTFLLSKHASLSSSWKYIYSFVNAHSSQLHSFSSDVWAQIRMIQKNNLWRIRKTVPILKVASFSIWQSPGCFPFSEWVFWWVDHTSLQKLSLLVTFWKMSSVSSINCMGRS